MERTGQRRKGEDRSVRGQNRRGGYRADEDSTEEEMSGEGRIQPYLHRTKEERRHQEGRRQNREIGGQN